jgi:high-affinity nickel-transport protein
MFGVELPLLSIGGVSIALVGGALALGFRHGIDWDHIAAITDITSTAAPVTTARESRLISEPGVLLTNESDHSMAGGLAAVHSHGLGAHEHAGEGARPALAERVTAPRQMRMSATLAADGGVASMPLERSSGGGLYERYVRAQSRPWLLGTMYALGHGTVVTALGLLAILASEVLPSWIDPVMERVVGVTLVVLAFYLFYSLFSYFRGGGEFHIRSRWMLVFAGVRNGIGWVRARFGGHEHTHVHAAEQYGARTAYGIGMIHGVGAETGTQALIIATAAGASTKATSIVVLLVFVFGLLISNSVVTIMSTSGFVSAQRRQWVYVAAGAFAAVFSLVIGLIFLAQAGDMLPDLGRYFEWLGGPST